MDITELKQGVYEFLKNYNIWLYIMGYYLSWTRNTNGNKIHNQLKNKSWRQGRRSDKVYILLLVKIVFLQKQDWSRIHHLSVSCFGCILQCLAEYLLMDPFVGYGLKQIVMLWVVQIENVLQWAMNQSWAWTVTGKWELD